MILLYFDDGEYNQPQDDKNYDGHNKKDNSMLHDSKRLINGWQFSYACRFEGVLPSRNASYNPTTLGHILISFS